MSDVASASCFDSEPLKIAADGALDVEQVTSALGRPVRQACLKDLDRMGGLSGDFYMVSVEFADGEKFDELVLKITGEGKEAVAASLGTPREGKFFAHLAPKLDSIVPRARFAYGDMSIGAKQVLMERLKDAVPAGVFFGKGNPNNWSLSDEDMASLVQRCGSPTATSVSAKAFELYAHLHARFWHDEAVRAEHSWLRGADWLLGKGKESWEAAQKLATDAWVEEKKSIASGSATLQWDPHAVACIDASLAKVDWQAFQEELSTRPWTVVHGDAHPHNMLQVNSSSSEEARLVLIDFEMVGLGSNAQELGQFLISHMEPDLRRSCERQLVQDYYKVLVDALRSRGQAVGDEGSYTFDMCWQEYIMGGAGRWLWFVPYLAKACPPQMGQFFHDQLAAFLHDHFKDSSSVPMPRV